MVSDDAVKVKEGFGEICVERLSTQISQHTLMIMVLRIIRKGGSSEHLSFPRSIPIIRCLQCIYKHSHDLSHYLF